MRMIANGTSTGIAQFVRALRAEGCAEQTDGQLVSRFMSRRDEAAFVALVRRHGPMVLGVCRRVLGDGADVEDAFQATFLVLVRKAASLTGRAVLGDWLHGVARRTALSARRACARRRVKEQAMARSNLARADETIENEWLPLLDEELSRLPEKYRLAIVLCDLEGKTRRQAAERLGWPEGTVAGRLARGRALLARRLLRRGGAVSSSSVATALAHGAASAGVPDALLHSTAQAANILAAGTLAGASAGGVGATAGTAAISARVAGLMEGVMRAMLLAKLKTVTCAVAVMVVVGIGGVTLVAGRSAGFQPGAGAAAAPRQAGDSRPDAKELVRQLGSSDFAKRLAAEKALTDLGARAAAAVQAGTKDTDAEIAKRCTALWPRLWQTEIARPDAERLAGYAHPLWDRFRKVAGDGPGSRTLYAEMVSDLGRYSRLEAAEADPQKASAAYAAALKERAEAIERGTQEAMEKYGRMTGPIIPTSGFPTRAEFITVLFLGTYPATAKDKGGDIHHNVFSHGIGRTNGAAAPIASAFRRLYAAWLAMRTAPQPLQIGLRLAFYHRFAEVTPTAIAHAGNDKLDPTARGFALLVIGRVGAAEHLPLLEKAFADARVYHMGNFTFKDGKNKAIETRVSDTAVAAALRIAGQDPADFGFTFMEMYRSNSLRDSTEHSLLGFFQDDDAARQAAHKKAREWLDKRGKAEQPTPKEAKLTPEEAVKSFKQDPQKPVTVEFGVESAGWPDGPIKVGDDQMPPIMADWDGRLSNGGKFTLILTAKAIRGLKNVGIELPPAEPEGLFDSRRLGLICQHLKGKGVRATGLVRASRPESRHTDYYIVVDDPGHFAINK